MLRPSLQNHAASAVIILDVQNRIVSASPDAAECFGCDQSLLVGRSISEYLPELPAANESSVRVTCHGVDGRLLDANIWQWKSSGETFRTLCFTASLEAESAGDRRRAEHAESEFSALLDAAVDGILVIDSHGLIEVFNASAERLFGYSVAEVLGQNIKMLMPEPYHAEHDDYLHNYLSTHKPKIIGIGREVSALRKDGTIFPIDLSVGEIKGGGTPSFVGIIRDATERKATEQALREREEQLRLTFSNAPLGIASLDLNGCFITVNKALCDMLGYGEAELLSKTFLDVTHSDDLSGGRDKYDGVVTGTLDSYTQEKRYIRSDGSVLDGVVHVAGVRDVQSKPFMMIAQVEDRTEWKQAETEARQHRERLAHVTRLGTMGEMAAGIAHEINQPLAAIATYAQACQRLAKAGLTEDVDFMHALVQVSEQAHRAGEVIRRLRSMVKRRESERELADINSVVEESVRLGTTDSRIDKLRVELELSHELPGVSVDTVQIQQVILNLVRNAIDAMESAGAWGEALIVSTGLGEHDTIEIAVEDSGIGLAPELASQLFTPFFTTKSSGMGMGLSISRSIVTSHGGKLQYRPAQIRGSIFTLTLPIALENENE